RLAVPPARPGRRRPDAALALREGGPQARGGSLPPRGPPPPPPLTVGGRLGEYIVGAFAALAAATAWTRASRTGVPETVDASLLEAMQMTYVTHPTLMARFPGGRMMAFRWGMIPGNAPTADGRF